MEFLGYSGPSEIGLLFRDVFVGNIGWLFAVSLMAFFRKRIAIYLRNSFFSDLRRLKGSFYGYRWTSTGDLSQPHVTIQQRWNGRYVLRWRKPGGDSFGEASFITDASRERYAIGADKKRAAYSYFVIHDNPRDPADFLVGVFCFLNASHQIVSGHFLLSRKKLDPELVERILPKTLTCASQEQAAMMYTSLASEAPA